MDLRRLSQIMTEVFPLLDTDFQNFTRKYGYGGRFESTEERLYDSMKPSDELLLALLSVSRVPPLLGYELDFNDCPGSGYGDDGKGGIGRELAASAFTADLTHLCSHIVAHSGTSLLSFLPYVL